MQQTQQANAEQIARHAEGIAELMEGIAELKESVSGLRDALQRSYEDMVSIGEKPWRGYNNPRLPHGRGLLIILLLKKSLGSMIETEASYHSVV